MPRVTLTLHPSEAVVIRAAAQIYAAYITAGRVKEGSEKEWMQRAPSTRPSGSPARATT